MLDFRKGVYLVILVVALTAVGCHRRETPEATASAPVESPKPQVSPLVGFAKDLQYIKNGQYTYIYVFSRKDGKSLEKSDSEFLRTNAPQMVDWAITEEGKKVIGGTNFNLADGNLELLKKKYVVEDFSGR
jgi:hypothetical protein